MRGKTFFYHHPHEGHRCMNTYFARARQYMHCQSRCPTITRSSQETRELSAAPYIKSLDTMICFTALSPMGLRKRLYVRALLCGKKTIWTSWTSIPNSLSYDNEFGIDRAGTFLYVRVGWRRSLRSECAQREKPHPGHFIFFPAFFCLVPSWA